MAVGYDNIDVEAATKRGIIVCNTPDVLTETTADLTFALLLATARRLIEAAEFIKEGKWKVGVRFYLQGRMFTIKRLELSVWGNRASRCASGKRISYARIIL